VHKALVVLVGIWQVLKKYTFVWQNYIRGKNENKCLASFEAIGLKKEPSSIPLRFFFTALLLAGMGMGPMSSSSSDSFAASLAWLALSMMGLLASLSCSSSSTPPRGRLPSTEGSEFDMCDGLLVRWFGVAMQVGKQLNSMFANSLAS
jgi:hypothetical protein